MCSHSSLVVNPFLSCSYIIISIFNFLYYMEIYTAYSIRICRFIHHCGHCLEDKIEISMQLLVIENMTFFSNLLLWFMFFICFSLAQFSSAPFLFGLYYTTLKCFCVIRIPSRAEHIGGSSPTLGTDARSNRLFFPIREFYYHL